MKNNEAEGDKIVKGLEETYRKLIEFKKLKNSPLIVSIDGKICELDPFKVAPTVKYKRGNSSQ